MTRGRLFVLLCAGAGLLAGCGEPEHEDLRAWMDAETKDIRGRVPPLPQVKPYEAAQYGVEAQLDPFKPGKIASDKKKSGVNQPDFNRPREPLESFPLESLAYVGLIVKDRVPHAIIQADAALYQVKVGNYAGQDFGVITAIDENQVSLKELITDPSGDWVERASSLKLQEKQKESGK